MTLILINPPAVQKGLSYYHKLVQQWGRPQLYSWPFEHLGLLSIKSYAEKQGIETALIDGMVLEHDALDKTLRAAIAIPSEIGREPLFGISSMVEPDETIVLAESIKAYDPNAKIVVGNNYGTLNARALLTTQPSIDFVVCGHGEGPIVALYRALANSEPRYESIEGLAWRRNGVIYVNQPSFADLLQLPWVSRESLPQVLELGMSAAISSKRGCPYRCSFCGTASVSALAKDSGVRSREVADVVDEIEMLVRDFAIPHLTIADDLFVGASKISQDWANAFADEMLRRSIYVSYMVDIRIDSYEQALFAKLRRTGLNKVFIGFESGDAGMARLRFNKKTSHRFSATAAIQSLEAEGIEIIPGMILFHAETTPKELSDNIAFIMGLKNKNKNIFRRKLTVYKGTQMHKEYLEKGYLKDCDDTNWHFKDPSIEKLIKDIEGIPDNISGSVFENTVADLVNKIC